MANGQEKRDGGTWNGEERRCCPRSGTIERIADITYKMMREATPDTSDAR